MAQKIIPCGGWYIDGTTLIFDDNKVLSAVGGSSNIPVLDMGAVSDTLPVQLPVTSEQIALAQQENAIVKITYQNITLQLQKIGQSATQVVFSGYVSDNNIFFFIDIANTQATFNIITTRQVPDVTEVQNGYALLAQDGEAVWAAINQPALATVNTAGLVKQTSNIEQFQTPSSATAQEIADKFNNLIQNLINAGIMVAGS